MTRFVVLLCALGVLIALMPSARCSGLTPAQGTYMGYDAHGRIVVFTFREGHIHHFMVGGTLIFARVLVHHATMTWEHLSAGKLSARGQWLSNHDVHGQWIAPNGIRTPFHGGLRF